MTRVTVDSDLRTRLLDLREPLVLCDESGKVIGEVTPLQNCLPPGYVEPPLSEEEWKRRQEGPDYSIDEVIAKLEQL
jgi:hypothetical protein